MPDKDGKKYWWEWVEEAGFKAHINLDRCIELGLFKFDEVMFEP
jgi:hypothetical protein